MNFATISPLGTTKVQIRVEINPMLYICLHDFSTAAVITCMYFIYYFCNIQTKFGFPYKHKACLYP